MERDPGSLKDFFAREQVFRVSVAALSDYMGVLNQQKLIWDELLLALFNEILLDSESVGVAEQAVSAIYTLSKHPAPLGWEFTGRE